MGHRPFLPPAFSGLVVGAWFALASARQVRPRNPDALPGAPIPFESYARLLPSIPGFTQAIALTYSAVLMVPF
jgi:hypothetical protein